MRVYNIPNKKKNFFESLSSTIKLIILNCFIFLIGLIVISIYGQGFFSNSLALKPSLIIQGKNLWTIIISMFFHANFFHLFANMFSLYFIGNFLEKIIGPKRFLKLYFVSGIIASLFFVGLSFFSGTQNIPGVGASGAIFGLLGVLAVLVPYSKIYLIAGPLILLILEIIFVPFLPPALGALLSSLINILFFVMIFAMLSFRSGFRKLAIPVELPMWLLPIIAIVPLVLIDLVPGIDLPIGNSAHFGGLFLGLIYGFYLRKKFPKKTLMLSRRFR